MGITCNKEASRKDSLTLTPPKPLDGPVTTYAVNSNQVEFSSDASADFLDVVFCIDTTSSMSSYIERSKKVIINMINFFSQNEEKPLFGVVAYRDHPPEDRTYVTKIHDINSAEKALDFVKKLEAFGGGDEPEAVLKGLEDSVNKISWRNLQIEQKTYKKLLIHVGDAPAHGKEFHNKNVHDKWPDKCPSGITLEKLARTINQNNIFYHFCRLNHQTDVMMEKFKGAFKRFEMIDLIVTKENLLEKRKEFEDYKEEFHDADYMNRSFTKMDVSEQNEVIYETTLTKCLAKNMKQKKILE